MDDEDTPDVVCRAQLLVYHAQWRIWEELGLGDEGGFAPEITEPEDVLGLLAQAIGRVPAVRLPPLRGNRRSLHRRPGRRYRL